MDLVEPNTRRCPFCGGEIQEAAILCRHCKRRLDGADVEQLVAAPAPPAVAIARSVTELVDFLVARKVVERARLEPVSRAAGTQDARVVLGHFQAAGLIAPAQTEALASAFRDSQSSTLSALLQSAISRGWLTSEHGTSAIQAYSAASFRRTPAEFAVDQGLLTQSQTQELAPSSTAASAGVTSGGSVQAVASTVASSSSTDPGRMIMIAGTVAVIAIIGVVYASAKGPPIFPNCTMNGEGVGSCRFTNVTTSTAASACGRIIVTCRQTGSPVIRSGDTFCSGEVEPSATKAIDFTVVGVSDIRPPYTDWRDSCEFTWSANGD